MNAAHRRPCWPRLALGLALGFCSFGCPANVPPPSKKSAAIAQKKLDPDDPRIMTVDGDQYRRPSKGEHSEGPQPLPGRNPGSGSPDETNGVCRLFAPKLPEPECCKAEWGFDVETAAKVCGHDVYLGESFYNSCGYYFHTEEGKPRWFRMSGVPGDSPADAAASHDRKVKRLYEDPGFQSTPVPGVPGALWSSKEGLNWAFIPGWSMVRLFTWRDDSCSRDGVIELLKTAVAAKQPAKGEARRGMIPIARR